MDGAEVLLAMKSVAAGMEPRAVALACLVAMRAVHVWRSAAAAAAAAACRLADPAGRLALLRLEAE